ncbi:MAG: TIGR02281 family clan AA aspartic protease [Acidiferrobacterales bacterium]
MAQQPLNSTHHGNVQRRLGKGMIYVGWLLALGLLTWAFGSWLDTQRNPNRHVKSMIEAGTQVVVLERNRYGHYHATGKINDREVEFMLDTGATTVSIPAAVAKRLGLKRGPAVPVSTANGTVMTYLTRLHSVRLGDIELNNVTANINPHTKSNEVLLGMSFLKHLEFTQRGDTLILKQLSH